MKWRNRELEGSMAKKYSGFGTEWRNERLGGSIAIKKAQLRVRLL